MDKPPEVLVFGNENPPCFHGHPSDDLVVSPSAGFRHGDDIMTGRTQGAHDGKIATFIRQESHGSATRLHKTRVQHHRFFKR